MVNLAVIGDVHLRFSQEDVTYFNRSHYDLLLFVGDLSNYLLFRGHRVARLMAGLQKETLFIPGNHDAVNALQLLAEIKQKPFLATLLGLGQGRRVASLRRKLNGVRFCGYSTHPYSIGQQRFDVVAGRPHSMGGPNLSCLAYLRRQFGVDSMTASAKLLKKQVDEAESDQLIFLAHNGPYGLGDAKTDIWGCDFKEEGGDCGDKDLRWAIEYARGEGKGVLAVVAGHMHHTVKGGGNRSWRVNEEGTYYINAARVPRIFYEGDKRVRHHLRLSFDTANVAVEEVLVS
jgi:uncharacterized protein (TIGR04168 family)